MTIWCIKILSIIFILILILGIFIYIRIRRQKNTLFKNNKPQNIANLDNEFASRGFFYSAKDDAFYSTADAPQGKFGCCQLYDDTMPLLGIIVNCEPIYFEYDNKKWVIEFWKGQYAIALGCQIGIYCTTNPPIKVANYQGMFYESPDMKDCFSISFTLKKKNKRILQYSRKDCFLAGLKMGEFSNPASLTLKVKIKFPNKAMRQSFVEGLKESGYASNEYLSFLRSVTLRITKPHTTQPASQTRMQEAIIQYENRSSCNKFMYLTKPFSNTPQRLDLLKDLDMDLYQKAMKSFYCKDIYSSYELIGPIVKKMTLQKEKETESSPNES